MANNEDEGRFLKSFYGLPNQSPLTRQEQSLLTETKILDILQERLPSSGYSSSPPRWEANVPPQISIQVPDFSSRLQPHFDDIARAQRETILRIGDLTEIGEADLEVGKANLRMQKHMADTQMHIAEDASAQTELAQMSVQQRTLLLAQGRLSVMLLESLNEAGREAFLQRQSLISALASIRHQLSQVGGGVDLVNVNLFGLREQGTVSISELQGHTRLLDQLVRLGGSQASSLYNIDQGVTTLAGRVDEMRGDIGRRIDAATVVTARIADHFAHMEGSLDLFVINMMEGSRTVQGIRDILRHPIRTRADEQWRMAEEARRRGEIEDSAHMAEEVITVSPLDPRPYYSLAMMSLDTGGIQAAHRFFAEGARRAQHEPDISIDFLIQMGRLGVILGHNEYAKALLERAHSMDKAAVAVWYELALVEMKLKNPKRAVWLLNNLLHVARRRRGLEGFVLKVMSEPFFAPILPYLNQ